MLILGLHGGFTVGQHEPSACLINNAEILGLYEEERFSRIKSGYGMLPKLALIALLRDNNVTMSDIELVVVPGKTYTSTEERWRLFLMRLYGFCPPILVVDHQEAHAAAAYFGSEFDNAVSVTLDSSGDGYAGSIYTCENRQKLHLLKKIPLSDSLGKIYTACTYHLGFEDGDEYKVMGLAPYGTDNSKDGRIFESSSETFMRTEPKILSPFDYPSNSEFIANEYGLPQRSVNSPISQDHKDFAFYLQKSLVNKLCEIFDEALNLSSSKNIVYSGGVALNCSGNGKLLSSSKNYRKLYVSPVASDRGLSYGCACLGLSQYTPIKYSMHVPYYGSQYSESDVIDELTKNKIAYKRIENISEYTAVLLSQGNIVGWFDGRSESGARALGHRSILASASSREMKDKLNASIKYREMFRPFAPVCTQEDAARYWHLCDSIDYSTMTYAVTAREITRSVAPSVVHVDGTSRLQTINAEQNNSLHKVLQYYSSITGHPILMNTSFNLKGQPIVESPRDALMTFFGCGIDHLVMGNIVVEKYAYLDD